jgi:hypothetical protein
MENVEEIQLKVEELLYKNDVDTLVKLAEKIKYEKIEELREQSRGRVINLLRRFLEELVEGMENPTAKIEVLNDALLMLGGPPDRCPKRSKRRKKMSWQICYKSINS